MRTFARWLALAALVSGCAVEPATPAPVTPEGAYEGPAATTAARPGGTPAKSQRVVVEQGEGEEAVRAQQVFAPLPKRIEECAAGATGAVTVRIVGEGEATRVDAATGRSLQGATRRCVIEALSTVDLDDLPSRSSPSNRPSGYTVLLRGEF